MVSPVHPRWRGEHRAVIQRDRHGTGSSPLARGTQGHPWPTASSRRFIPAGAGNTLVCGCVSIQTTVHPRWRGEHVTGAVHDGVPLGSSPLARGTHRPCTQHHSSSRFIPAGAGNTSAAAARHEGDAVHPRWRGEHTIAQVASHWKNGSSPLARGTRLPLDHFAGECRFIPAGAGNTPFC